MSLSFLLAVSQHIAYYLSPHLLLLSLQPTNTTTITPPNCTTGHRLLHGICLAPARPRVTLGLIPVLCQEHQDRRADWLPARGYQYPRCMLLGPRYWYLTRLGFLIYWGCRQLYRNLTWYAPYRETTTMVTSSFLKEDFIHFRFIFSSTCRRAVLSHLPQLHPVLLGAQCLLNKNLWHFCPWIKPSNWCILSAPLYSCLYFGRLANSFHSLPDPQ